MNEILQKQIEEAATFLFKQRGLDKEPCRQAMDYILANQWISVEEGLPPYDKAVIGMDYTPELAWDDQTIIFVHRSNNPDVITDKNKFCVYPPRFCKVTHWMPIPTTDKEQIKADIRYIACHFAMAETKRYAIRLA